jgi:hypothetical protein
LKYPSRSWERLLLFGMGSIFFVLGSFRATSEPNARQGITRRAVDLPDQINTLARQLDGEPYYQAGAIPGQIQNLVVRSLTAWFNRDKGARNTSPYPLEVRVRMQLENDFSKLHYPFFGHPATFVQQWQGRELVGAGYTLGWSDFDRVNCVALFEGRRPNITLKAITNFVPQTDLHFAFLPTSPSGDFRFITYGYLLGKSQPRLTAILYSFDGKALKNLWEKRDLYDGKIRVTRLTVTLRYVIEDEYVQAVQQNQLPPGHEAIYTVTPQGLALETDHEIPYREVVLR